MMLWQLKFFFVLKIQNNVLFFSHINTTTSAFSLWVKEMKHFNYLLAFILTTFLHMLLLKKV